MGKDFLEKNKVMFSALAVIVFGGAIFAGTFQPRGVAGDVTQSAGRPSAPKKPINSPKKFANNPQAGWAAATSFDDMLDDEPNDDDNNGFGDAPIREPGIENDSFEEMDDAASSNEASDPSSFPTASPPSRPSSQPAKRPQNKIVADAEGLHDPIKVDPSRVSGVRGAKGKSKPGEID